MNRLEFLEKLVEKLADNTQQVIINCKGPPKGQISISKAILDYNGATPTDKVKQSTIGCELLVEYLRFGRFHEPENLKSIARRCTPFNDSDIQSEKYLEQRLVPHYLEAYELAWNWTWNSKCSGKVLDAIKKKIISLGTNSNNHFGEMMNRAIQKVLNVEIKVRFLAWFLAEKLEQEQERIVRRHIRSLDSDCKAALLSEFLQTKNYGGDEEDEEEDVEEDDNEEDSD